MARTLFVLGEGKFDDLVKVLEDSLKSEFGSNYGKRFKTEIKEWLAFEMGVSPDEITDNNDDLAFEGALLLAGTFIALTAEGGPAVQVEMLKDLHAMLEKGYTDAYGVYQLLQDMSYAAYANPNGRTALSEARNFLFDFEGGIASACSATVVATNGGPNHSRDVCSEDIYAGLLPYDQQIEGLQTFGVALGVTAGAVATGAFALEIAAAAVGYVTLYSPYISARLSQMAPNLTARGQAMFRLGVINNGPQFRTWNQFQGSTQGQFSTRAEASAAWQLYKEANGIVTGTYRSQAAKSQYLQQLAESGKAPSWMNQWLNNGKVPPGYAVDHIKPLSVGGADSPSNMRLLDIDLHRLHHRYYRPWEK